jgi:hypothetical protein
MGEEPDEAIARIGDRELRITSGQFRSAIEQLDQAEFTVEFAEGNDWVEYLAPVKVEVDGHSMFEGQTTTVFPQGNGVEMHAQSAVSLTEERSHGLLTEDCDHRDLVYAMVREAGFDDDHIEIEGLDELQTEVFEVVVGVEGIEVDGSYRVGSVTFLSHEDGLRALDHFDADPECRGEFGSASAFALAYLTTARMYHAEQGALGDIEATLSWLATRTRYGCSHLPDGTLNAYVRSESNATPKRTNLVALRAPMSGRRWLRRLGPRVRASPLQLNPRSRLGEPRLPARLALEERQAILSAERALSADDPIQRSQAIWESLEFYLAGRPPERLFEKAERRELLKRLREALPVDHAQRVADLVEMVDKPSVRLALRRALKAEAIPITDSELALLDQIRAARNRATHGGEVEVPSNEDLDYACSILSRILVHRIERLASGR